MFQDRFAAVAPQAFTSDGGADGTVAVADTTLFKVGQQVLINANTLDTLDALEVKKILSATSLIVGPSGGAYYTFTDISAYTVVLSASISANEQNRPTIIADDFERAVYEEEPTVAKRVVLVDQLGKPYKASGGGGGGGTVDQGVPNTNANGWPVKITDGTNVLGTSSHPVAVDGSGVTQPISAASLPLPANAAQETGGNLAAIATHQTDGTQQTQVTNFPATQPISAVSLPLPTGAATAANQATEIANLQAINSLTPSVYDYIELDYTGANLTTVVYKLGGAGGSVVSTLTLGYTGANLTSVTKS